MNIWESTDKMVKKEIIYKKVFSKKPMELAVCNIYVENPRSLNFSFKQIKEDLHSEIIDKDFKKVIVIGEANSRIDNYIEKAVQTMSVCEQSLISVKVPLDEQGKNFDCVSVILTLEAIESNKPIWEWSLHEKYKVALKYKEKGVQLFKTKRYEDAFYKFSKACKILITLRPLNEDEPVLKDAKDLRYVLYNNMAECHLIKKNYNHVLTLCSKILNNEEHNIKALYRRGVAYGNLKDYENAVNDLKMANSLEPQNTKVQKQFNIYNQQWQVSVQRYESIVRKMFRAK